MTEEQTSIHLFSVVCKAVRLSACLKACPSYLSLRQVARARGDCDRIGHLGPSGVSCPHHGGKRVFGESARDVNRCCVHVGRTMQRFRTDSTMWFCGGDCQQSSRRSWVQDGDLPQPATRPSTGTFRWEPFRRWLHERKGGWGDGRVSQSSTIFEVLSVAPPNLACRRSATEGVRATPSPVTSPMTTA